MIARHSAAAAALGVGLALAATPASAALLTYRADLTPLNNSGVSGAATFILDTTANTLNFTVHASGLFPNSTHPEHIHGLFEQAGCNATVPSGPVAGLCLDGTPRDSHVPTLANDIDGDHFLETLEGEPVYGPIILNLADPSAGRPPSFPMSDAAGNLDFSATYDLNTTDLLYDPLNGIEHDPGDLFPLDERVFVIHGVFVNNDNPAVPGDMFEVQGPTHSYVPLLPAAAGELQLVSAVPEPGTLGLLGAALAGFVGLGWRRRPRAS